MKQLFTLLLVLGTWQFGWAQCSTCVPDQTLPFTQHQLNNGGYLPAPLPPVEQGVYFDTVVTFVFPANVNVPPIGNISVDSVRIDNVGNLPPGISWTTNSPNNTFYPQQSPYGCVRLCGTTYRAPGIDSAKVTIRGFALGQSQAQDTYIVYEVIPGSVGTGSFTAVGIQGCDSVTATFEALIDATPQITKYGWDFGNGNTSTDKIPAPQIYNTPGVYAVVLNTFIGNLRVGSVSISSVNENWEDTAVECNDLAPVINTPLCANQKPDLFVVITDLTSGGVVYTSSAVDDQNPPVSFNNINANLTGGGPYSITIWDDDSGVNPTSDDLIGTFGMNSLTEGTHTFGSGQTTGSYTLYVEIIDTISDTVEVVVNAGPAEPVITNMTGADTICGGDTIILSINSSPGSVIQWFQNTNELIGMNDTFLVINLVSQTGAYSVLVTDTATSCQSSTDTTYQVLVNSRPPVPVIAYQSASDRLALNNGSSYTRQWYYNGVPIPGATDVYYNTPQPGTYTVLYTNASGCTTYSGEFNFTGIGINQPQFADMTTRVYPNPNTGLFNIEFNTGGSGEVSYTLFNMLGQAVYSATTMVNGTQVDLVDAGPLSEGVYLLKVEAGENVVVQKVIVKK